MVNTVRVSSDISGSDMTNEFVTSQLVVTVVNLVVMKRDWFEPDPGSRPL